MFTHLDKNNKAQMVDVSEKNISSRIATAQGKVYVSEELFNKIVNSEISKGDVLTVAKIAGIAAAKKTAELIPLCHNIFLTSVDIQVTLSAEDFSLAVVATVKTNSVTGVEMEALTAASVSCLTIYDMCKAIDKSIVISDIRLIHKSGGKSGEYLFNSESSK